MISKRVSWPLEGQSVPTSGPAVGPIMGGVQREWRAGERALAMMMVAMAMLMILLSGGMER